VSSSEIVNDYPSWSPRFWAGLNVADYFRLMRRNRFRIHPSRYGMTIMVGGCSVMSTGLSLIQNLVFGKRIRNTRLEPPVFVIGHWRSGTTLLHELLALDPQFSWPTTFQCFVPSHFLVSSPLLKPLVRVLMPKRRPMDSMPAGADLPQEDEFALAALGAPSPYLFLAFCQETPPHLDMLNLEGASDRDVEKLRNAMTRFYKALAYRNPGRLVLKSPTHTGRMAALARWFPDARFIHISRHPGKVVPSTVHLWRSLASVQGYQLPSREVPDFEPYVHRCQNLMYDGYFRDRELIPENQRLEMRFEDLIESPLENMERIYDEFGFEGFSKMIPRIRQFLESRQDHKSNRIELTESLRQGIDLHWARYMDAFGYQLQAV
jgi:omega-hydroxy-beta-dihydromenaquinone-9 sulfotransferase